MKPSTSHDDLQRDRELRTACAHSDLPRSGGLRASLPDDHPIATLMDEHQSILAQLERLAEIACPTDADRARPRARGELEELARLAHHLLGVEPHLQREEQVLFPALQARGIHGPPEAMTSEHVQLRALEHALHDRARRLLAGETHLCSDMRDTAEALIENLRAHIAKEDVVLYPLALRTIREPAEWVDLRRRCDAIGYCCSRSGVHADEHG